MATLHKRDAIHLVPEVPGRATRLVRTLSPRALTLNIINLTVGASIFVLPAQAAADNGAAALLAYGVAAAALAMVALCFSEIGSRVVSSGGPYAYADVSFGPYIGFLTGVTLWFGSEMASSAAVAVLFGDAFGELVPSLHTRYAQMATIGAVYTLLAATNIWGVRTGTRLVERLTAVKLAPLLLVIAAGLPHVHAANLIWRKSPSPTSVADATLIVIFAFMGMETALTASGEIRAPSITVPGSLAAALGFVTLLYVGLQLVAQGVLGPMLPLDTSAPLAHVVALSVGDSSGWLILVATALSSFSYLAGDMLASPRALFGLAENGHLPRWFASVHRRHASPYVAIGVHAACASVFAISGTFHGLAVLAVVSTLLVYLVCAVAVLSLRRRDRGAAIHPFVAPLGPVVPLFTATVVMWLLSRSTRHEFVAVAVMLVIATFFYFCARLMGKRRAEGVRGEFQIP